MTHHLDCFDTAERRALKARKHIVRTQEEVDLLNDLRDFEEDESLATSEMIRSLNSQRTKVLKAFRI